MPSLLEKHVARKTQKPADSPAEPEAPRKTTTKVFVALLRKAKMVATHRGIDLFDYFDGILAPAVDRDYQDMIRKEGR